MQGQRREVCVVFQKLNQTNAFERRLGTKQFFRQQPAASSQLSIDFSPIQSSFCEEVGKNDICLLPDYWPCPQICHIRLFGGRSIQICHIGFMKYSFSFSKRQKYKKLNAKKSTLSQTFFKSISAVSFLIYQCSLRQKNGNDLKLSKVGRMEANFSFQ